MEVRDEKKVINYLTELVKENDQKKLDLVLIFLYSIPSQLILLGSSVKSENEEKKNKFKDYIGKLGIHTLQTKYKIEIEEAIQCLKKVSKLFDVILDKIFTKESFRDLWDPSNYNRTVEQIKLLFFSKTSELYLNDIKKRLNSLSNNEKKVLLILLNAIDLTTEEGENSGYYRKKFAPYRYSRSREQIGVKFLSLDESFSSIPYENNYTILINFQMLLNHIPDDFVDINLNSNINELKIGDRKLLYCKIHQLLFDMGFLFWYFRLTRKGNISPGGYNYVMPSIILNFLLSAFKEKIGEDLWLKNQFNYIEIGRIKYPKKAVDKYNSSGKIAYRTGKFTKSFKEWYEKTIDKELNDLYKNIEIYFLKEEKLNAWDDIKSKYIKSIVSPESDRFLEKDIENYVISNLEEIQDGLKIMEPL